MKKMQGRALALALSLSVLGIGGSALADESAPEAPAQTPGSAISVQLDGKNLKFTDAVPQTLDQHVFLPFRAIFEDMGAQVSNEGNTITAVRGDKTVVMTVGSTDITVTENGVSKVISMDVAPYVDETTWRTYVPIRFAAQSMGCAVGWDQDNQTAILVDTKKMIDSAMAQHEYTYLDKYMEYSNSYQSGAWDMALDFDGTGSMMGSQPFTFTGTVDGTVADNSQMDMNMNMKMDMQAFLEDLAQSSDGSTTGLTDEEKDMMDLLKSEGVGMELRADLSTGTMYLTFSGKALEDAGLPVGAWYSIDMSGMYSQMGIDYKELMGLSKSMDVSTVLQAALGSASFTDSDTAYNTVNNLVTEIATALADDAFVKDGDNYTATYALDQDGTGLDISFSLQMKKDAVVGYSLDMSVSDEQSGMTMDVLAAMDENNQMTATVNMDVASMMTMSMSMKGGYTVGTNAPEITPPDGAVIIPMDQVFGG